jgi:hypothetical protein
LYRQAIALFLQARPPDENEKNGRPKSEDEAVESARTFLREQARRILSQAAELDLASDISVQLDQGIAAFLSRAAGADTSCHAAAAIQGGDRTGPPHGKPEKGEDKTSPSTGAPQVELAKLLDQLRDKKREFDRDELERLMLAYRLRIQQGEGELDVFTRLDLAERLHEYCRSALRLANADPGVLSYLRPYFDSVFRVKVKYQPVGTKELIELIWEATTGDLNPPPIANQPVLAMYFLDDRCHLVLDVPHGPSGRFEIDPEDLRSVDVVKQASEFGRVFPCPDGLRRGLRAIKLAKGQKLLVHYRDPVHGLGLHVTMRPPSDRPSNPVSASYIFPFDIRSALADLSYEIGLIEVIGFSKQDKPSEEIPASPIKDDSHVSSSR